MQRSSSKSRRFKSEKNNKHENGMSFQLMMEKKAGTDHDVLQEVILYPKGVMLWSQKTIEIYH